VPAQQTMPLFKEGTAMDTISAQFSAQPQPTIFVVNVIHAHPGKQEEAFRLIQDVVHYVAERKDGFLWSNLAKSTDGLTVVNIEAIKDTGNVDEFFSDPVFVEKFRKLNEVSTSEFHTYTVGDLVLPKLGSSGDDRA
jgi:hypothetical protein